MTETSHHIADAGRDNWVERLLPLAVQSYAQLMRLDRPIGWWLLLLPCWWGLFLAQASQGGGLPNLWFAFLFLVGAIVMRGAGCTLNDIVDRNYDGRVARTKGRPIPSGRVSVKQAFIFLGGIFWTLAYDTIYAHQDREDDVLIGVKSTAVHFGENTKGWLGGFLALALISIDAALWLAGASFIAHMGVGFAALHAGWQIKRFEINNSALCLRLFKSNRDFGLIIASFLFLDCLIP